MRTRVASAASAERIASDPVSATRIPVARSASTTCFTDSASSRIRENAGKSSTIDDTLAVRRPKPRRPSVAATYRSRVDLGTMSPNPKVTIDSAERYRHVRNGVGDDGTAPVLVWKWAGNATT